MSRAWGVKKAFHPACPAAAQALGFIPPVSLWAKFEIHNLVDSFAFAVNTRNRKRFPTIKPLSRLEIMT